MAIKMKQALTTKIGEVVIKEVPDPVIGKEEAIITVKSVGICNSDIAPFKGELQYICPLPYVMGHEFGGIVKEINSKSDKFKAGDKVAVYPEQNCGNCYYCKNEMETLCPNQVLFGSPKKSGGLSEFIVVPVENLVKLGDSFKIEYAGLIEPAAVANHTVGKYKSINAVIIGVGGIGAIMCQILKYNGCKSIAVDIDERALDVAKNLGADLTLNINDKNLYTKIAGYLGNGKVDVAVLTHLNQFNLDFALEVARKGGTIIEMATPEDSYLLDFKKLMFKAVKLIGSICYSKDEFTEAANLIEKGVIEAEKIITRMFPLSEIAEAFDYKANNFALKVIITN
jgi:L-iditol 2-dehydrogenase